MTISQRRGTYTGNRPDAKGKALQGKTSLLLLNSETPEIVKAQFDDVATGLGHGWHVFDAVEFELEPETDWED